MNYKEVLKKYDEIATAKGNAKHPLIREFLQDKDFLKVTRYILDTSKTFKISKISEMNTLPKQVWDCPGKELFGFLDYLDRSKGATKQDKNALLLIASESPEKFTIVNKILRGKTDAGFTNKTIHKLAPGLIPYFPYMRCKGIAYLHKIDFPCCSDLKADGLYHEFEDGVFRTRNGKQLDFSLVPYPADMPSGVRFMGEITMVDETGNLMNRRDSNAIINKAQHSGLSQEEADRVRFEYWDIDTGDTLAPYKDRIGELGTYNVPLIESRIVRDMDEAWEHYDEVRARGLEGTILKNFKGLWKDGTSMNQVKIKATLESELEVYDIVPGKDKYEGMVGSLCCRSSCGSVVTDVGMKLTDKDRSRKDWVGKIITVRFNEVSKSKAKDTYALSHARLVEERLDKEEADDLKYILELKEVKRK